MWPQSARSAEVTAYSWRRGAGLSQCTGFEAQLCHRLAHELGGHFTSLGISVFICRKRGIQVMPQVLSLILRKLSRVLSTKSPLSDVSWNQEVCADGTITVSIFHHTADLERTLQNSG